MDEARPRSGRARTIPMELDEANRIATQFQEGSLDASLPGTMALVNEARRVQVYAQLWGTVRQDPGRRRRQYAIMAGWGLVLIALIGFALPFATSH